MPKYRVAVSLLSLACLSGCGGQGPDRPGVFRSGCEEAIGHGIAPGRASAKLVAQANLSYQAQDLRGFMIKDGYRAVVVRAARIECHPYALGFGLTQCVAKSQLCSR